MKVLITGYRGFIGRSFVEKFPDFIGVEKEDSPKEISRKMSEADAVIHLGGCSSTTEKDLDYLLGVNVDYSLALLDESIRRGIPFQYASSASIYGNPNLGDVCKETDLPQPLSAYAWSKYLLEREVGKRLATTKKFAQVQGFRYFNVFGNGEGHKANMMSPVSRFKNQAKKEGFIQLFENSDSYYRDFVFVEDLVYLQSQFLEKPISGVWNIGSGKPVSFASIAEYCSDLYGAPIINIPMPEKLKNQYQKWTRADMTNTFRALGLVSFYFISPNDFLGKGSLSKVR